MEEDDRSGHLLPRDRLYAVPAVRNLTHAFSCECRRFPRTPRQVLQSFGHRGGEPGVRTSTGHLFSKASQTRGDQRSLGHLISELISIRTRLGMTPCPGCGRRHHVGITRGRQRPTLRDPARSLPMLFLCFHLLWT